MQKKFLWKVLALVGLAVIAGAVVLLYVFVLKPQPIEGIKNIEVLIRAEDGEISETRRYQVRTDAQYLGEVLGELDEQFELGMTIENGMVMEMLGITTPADWSKYFYYYTTNPALYDAEGEFFGGYVSYDGTNFGAPDYGVSDATLADGTDYLLVYTAYGQYNSTDKPVPVIESQPVSAEVWLSEEAKNYDKRETDATNMLITVCSVAGAAFLVLTVLLVVEAVKAKKQ